MENVGLKGFSGTLGQVKEMRDEGGYSTCLGNEHAEEIAPELTGYVERYWETCSEGKYSPPSLEEKEWWCWSPCPVNSVTHDRSVESAERRPLTTCWGSSKWSRIDPAVFIYTEFQSIQTYAISNFPLIIIQEYPQVLIKFHFKFPYFSEVSD